jgi:hypothetical protein
MEHYNNRELSIIYGRRFGQIAVNMGFVTIEQVKEALAEQIACNTFSLLRPRKLIGEILFEKGWITLHQIEKVLEDISEGKNII